MSAFDLKTGKIVGSPSEIYWSQTHVFSPKDDKKRALFGSLVAALSFKSKKTHPDSHLAVEQVEEQEQIDIASFGKEIISRLHENYYSSEEKETLIRLKISLQNLIAEFSDKVDLQVSACVATSKDDKIGGYFAISGGGKAVILRNSQIVTILSGKEGEVRTASGYLENNDIFVLATSQFFNIISDGVLKASLENTQVTQAVESLATIVQASENDSQTAAVVFNIKTIKEENLEEQSLKSEQITEKPSEHKRRSIKDFFGKSILFAKNFPFLTQKLLRDFKKQPNIFIIDKGRRARAKKTTLSVAVILIVLLLVSVVFGSKRKSVLKDFQTAKNVYEEADYKYQQAIALIELNPLRARSLLTEAREIIEGVKNEVKEEKEKERLMHLLAQIEQELEKAVKAYKLEKAELFLDLGLIKDGFKGDDWGFSDEYLQILDQKTGTVLEVNITSKSARVSAGGEKLTGAVKVGAAEGKIIVLKKRDLLVVDKEKGEVVDEKKGEDFGEIVDLVGFGGNAYLLDTGKGKIFKYTKDGQGFSSAKNYFTIESFDLEGGVSFTIDGSVWVLFSDGSIIKFIRGSRDSFLISGLDIDLDEPEKIYTDENLDNLYVLDRKNTRIVVISKDTGEYQAQYIWPGIAGACDIFASEEEGKILLLMGERIYEIPLRD